MLLQFSVENYLSFKEQAILSLVPSSDKEHLNNINDNGTFKGLNTIAIYGANASGKSNLFKAVTIALNMIRSSANTQVDQLLPVVPFKLDDESRSRPSAFEFQFVASDGKKYVYGFSAFPDRILEEYLYCYNTSWPTKVFDRTEIDSYTFSRSTKKELEAIVRFTTKNRLFISSATLMNAESTRIAYEWLSKGIDTYMNVKELEGNAFAYYKADRDNNRRANIEFTKELSSLVKGVVANNLETLKAFCQQLQNAILVEDYKLLPYYCCSEEDPRYQFFLNEGRDAINELKSRNPFQIEWMYDVNMHRKILNPIC